MRNEPSQPAVLTAAIVIATIAGVITALLIDDTLTAIIVAGIVGAMVGFSPACSGSAAVF